MSTPGEINSNFYQIVYVDGDGNPTEIKPQYIANVSNVANANYANYANHANTANIANSVSVSNVVGIGNIATVNLTGSSSNVLYGNGVFGPVTALPSANANYANYAGNAFSVSGANVTGYVANATHATVANSANSVSAANIIGTVNLANYATVANSVAGANVSGYVPNATHANISDSANLVTVANVSGIGNIATINKDGNASNILYGNGVFAAAPSVGNVANANYANFAGTAYSVSGSNVSGQVANANYSNYSNIANSANSVSVSNVSGIGNIATVNLDGNVSNVLSGLGTWVSLGTAVNANYANYAGNVTIASQPNITSVGNLIGLQFNNTVTPVATPNIGEMFWDTGEHTVTLGMENGVKQQIGLESYIYVKASSAITNGQVVMFTGGSGNNVEAAPADVTSINFRPGYVLGLATQDIALNGFGYITTFGVVHGLNTLAYNVGDLLWLNPSVVGGLTNTEPAAPNYQIQIGTVNKKSGGDGHIQVIIRINPKLDDISDVTLTSPTSGQALVLDGGNVWINGNPNIANIAYSVSGSNVSGQVGNALVAGTVYTNSQPNITSIGTLTSLNVSGDTVLTGNLTVGGTTEYTNVNNLYITDPIIQLGGGANNTALTSNDGKDRGTLLNYYTTTPVSAFMGWDNSNAEFAFGSNVTVASEVVTYNALGNIRANYFIGNGSQLTGVNASNASTIDITSDSSNTSNQYVTFVGTSTTASAQTVKVDTGLIWNPNNNVLYAGQGFYGTLVGSTGTPIQNNSSIYVNGGSGNLVLSVAGTVRANITNTGLVVTGTIGASSTITAPSFTSNVATGTAPFTVTSTTQVANLSVATAGSATTAGTVTTAAQPNITSTGTLTSLTVSGNVSVGNISSSGLGNVANVLFTKYNETVVSGGSTGAATLTPNAAAGTIYTYTVTGNITLSTLTNAVAGTSMVVILTQGGAGSFTLTSTMKFAGGSKTLSTAVGAIDIISIFYDGSTYYATLSKGYA